MGRLRRLGDGLRCCSRRRRLPMLHLLCRLGCCICPCCCHRQHLPWRYAGRRSRHCLWPAGMHPRCLCPADKSFRFGLGSQGMTLCVHAGGSQVPTCVLADLCTWALISLLMTACNRSMALHANFSDRAQGRGNRHALTCCQLCSSVELCMCCCLCFNKTGFCGCHYSAPLQADLLVDDRIRAVHAPACRSL